MTFAFIQSVYIHFLIYIMPHHNTNAYKEDIIIQSYIDAVISFTCYFENDGNIVYKLSFV